MEDEVLCTIARDRAATQRALFNDYVREHLYVSRDDELRRLADAALADMEKLCDALIERDTLLRRLLSGE